MYISESFIPILKNNPSEAKIKSHQLMLRVGMIKQSSAGIYSWLPLGFKVMKKIEQIVREEQNKIGAQEILMPTIQSSEIWKESGRYEDYGEEMLRIKDRQNREMLYGPTNEELVTDIFRSSIKSYKSLPQLLYHIQWKFRDEIRPRFGIMRCREFYMKDAYSFDVSDEEAIFSYNKFFLSYLKTFKRLDLTAIPMAADTGPIGGNLSHEFIILAETGESKIFTDKRIFELNSEDTKLEKKSLESLRNKYEKFYAVTDEKFNEKEFEEKVSQENRLITKGIDAVSWFTVGEIASSWITSPLIAGILAFLIYLSAKKLILNAKNQVTAAISYIPFYSSQCELMHQIESRISTTNQVDDSSYFLRILIIHFGNNYANIPRVHHST